MSMRLGCCCGEANPCIDCEPDVNVCCLKVTRSGWARPRYIRSSSNCPDSPWTNLCGNGVVRGVGCAFVNVPEVGVGWHVDAGDCSEVIFNVLFRAGGYEGCSGTVTYPELRQTYSLAGRSWYTSGFSFSAGVETVTIEPCNWTTDRDISETTPDPVTLFFVWTDEFGNRDWIGASGTTLCGSSLCTFTAERFGPLAVFRWFYDIWTDKIIIRIQAGIVGIDECVEIDYDDGNWINSLGTLTFTANADLIKVDSCDSDLPNDQCLTDAAEGTIALDFTFTVDGTECSGWDAPLGPHSITAGAPWVYVSDATHYISKMRLILDNLNPGIRARLQILYTDDPANFEANMIEYTGTVDGECIDGQFFGSVVFTGPICASSSTAPVVTIDFTGPP